jgi:hypothetical protein
MTDKQRKRHRELALLFSTPSTYSICSIGELEELWKEGQILRAEMDADPKARIKAGARVPRGRLKVSIDENDNVVISSRPFWSPDRWLKGSVLPEIRSRN